MTFCLFKFNRGLEPPKKLYWVRRSRLGARLVTRGLLVNQVLCDKTEKKLRKQQQMRFSSWLGSQSHRANIRCIAEGRKSCKISRCCECPTKRAVLRNIHCFNLNLKDTLALSLHNILSTHLNESYTFQSIRRHERVILCTSLPLPHVTHRTFTQDIRLYFTTSLLPASCTKRRWPKKNRNTGDGRWRSNT